MGKYCDRCKADAKGLFEQIKTVTVYSVEGDIDGIYEINAELCKNCRIEIKKNFRKWLKND